MEDQMQFLVWDVKKATLHISASLNKADYLEKNRLCRYNIHIIRAPEKDNNCGDFFESG